MNPLETADALHEEAGRVLHDSGIDAVLRSYGTVSYTGSYSLNVMAWPDIDIHMVMEPDPAPRDAFLKMGDEIVRLDGVWKLNFSDHIRHPRKDLPVGLYWGVRIDTGRKPDTWKVDIWALNSDCVAENQAVMERFRQALDEGTRRVILEVKHALMLPSGRTPSLSGYHICNAVLFEGLRAEQEVREYLRRQGVDGV